MTKLFLIMDEPKGCFYCDCCHTKDFDYRYKIDGEKICGIEDIDVDDYYDYVSPRKLDWCPLKELPEKVNRSGCYDEYGDGYANGWNECLEEIIGEE